MLRGRKIKILAKNTKIKTSGLKSILKKLNYNVAVSIKRIHRGYITNLLAIDSGSMFNLKLTLKECGDSVIRVHMLDINTNRDYSGTSLFGHDFRENERKELAEVIINTVKIANNEVRLFGNCTLKEMFVALTDIKKIKELYSLNERAYKIYKEIDSAI